MNRRIGFSDKKMMTSGITSNAFRTPYNVNSRPVSRDQSGDGFLDILQGVIRKGSEAAMRLQNKIPSSDEKARPGFPGEKHAILKLPNGKFGKANYMGPGTHLLERLKRGDPPRTATDMASKGHDIRYGLAADLADVRRADNIMIKKVKEIQRRKTDSRFNIAQAKLIQLKVKGESLGVLRQGAFSGDLSKNDDLSKAEKNLLKSNLAPLAQQGFGLLPGDMLKMSVLKKLARKKRKKVRGKGRKKTKGASSDVTLPGMKSFKLMGSGKDNVKPILKFVMKKIVPGLLRSVGIKKSAIPISTISTIVMNALSTVKDGKISKIVPVLAKTFLPLLVVAKGRMAGKGHDKSVKAVLGRHKNRLLKLLSKGLMKHFQVLVNEMFKRNNRKPPFSGRGLKGSGSFWSGFKKGFLSVIKPGLKALTAVTTAVAPEFALPLGIASTLVDKIN